MQMPASAQHASGRQLLEPLHLHSRWLAQRLQAEGNLSTALSQAMPWLNLARN